MSGAWKVFNKFGMNLDFLVIHTSIALLMVKWTAGLQLSHKHVTDYSDDKILLKESICMHGNSLVLKFLVLSS